MQKPNKTDKAIKIGIIAGVVLMVFLIVFLVVQVMTAVKSPWEAAKDVAVGGFSQQMADDTFADDIAEKAEEIREMADEHDTRVQDALEDLRTVMEENNVVGGGQE